MSTTSNEPEEIRADIERTRGELSRDVDALGDKVNPTHVAKRQVERVRSGVASVKDRVMGSDDAPAAAHSTPTASSGSGAAGTVRDAAASVSGTVRDAATSVGDAVGSAPGAIRERTQGAPLAAGVVAFGIGLLAAGLVPSSRREREAAQSIQEAAAPLVDDVKDAASTVRDNLTGPARDSAQAVQETAKEGARSVAEEGLSAAQDVRSGGDDA